MKALFIGGPADGQMREDFDGRQFINVAAPMEPSITRSRVLRDDFGVRVVTYHRQEFRTGSESFFYYLVDGMSVIQAIHALFESYHESGEAMRDEPQSMSELRIELSVALSALAEEREFSLGALRALVEAHGSGCQCVHCIQYRAGTFKRMRCTPTSRGSEPTEHG